VFVSYRPADAEYVSRLSAHLIGAGVPVWRDEPLLPGKLERDDSELRIDRCAAFVAVLGPDASAAPVVEELEQAQQSGRPVFALFFAEQGAPGCPSSVSSERVVGGAMPSPGLVRRLRELVGGKPRARMVGPCLPARNPYFAGRDVELAELRDGLQRRLRVAVHGSIGIGKTQLLAEFAYRHDHLYDLIGWINAEQVDLIADQLAILATDLHLPQATQVRRTKPRAVVAREVLAALAVTPLRWLLIFDNADRAATVAPFVPSGGAGHVVVTSREPGWHRWGPTVEVDLPSRDQTVAQLRRRAAAVDQRVADQFCNVLGDLPLAVSLAGAVVAESPDAAPGLLTALRKRVGGPAARGGLPGYPQTRGVIRWPAPRRDAASHAASSHAASSHAASGHDAASYKETVRTVWELSRDWIAQTEPAAAVLLELCAYLGPDPIPLDLVKARPEGLPAPLDVAAADPVWWKQIVEVLLRIGVVSHSHDYVGICVHPLLAAAVREHPKARPERLRHAVDMLAAAAPDDTTEDVEGWPAWARLLPHARAALTYLPPDHPDPASKYLRTATERFGNGTAGTTT
jgi:hypothetical protein